MGLLKVDVKRKGAVKNLYQGVRSWMWCALAYSDGQPTFLASGYWDIGSPPETSIFRLKEGALVSREELARVKLFKELQVALSIPLS
ncbi:MAG: hypothetical protein BGO01_07720 [Armatimonadetes bacterium 55-13]|nr:MAG: hypothetical protein BGO01_07720 [Armatimonadetes bacterium 55-13]